MKTKTGLTYFAKGSPQAKAHMAKLRAMAAAKRNAGGSLPKGLPWKKGGRLRFVCDTCLSEEPSRKALERHFVVYKHGKKGFTARQSVCTCRVERAKDWSRDAEGVASGRYTCPLHRKKNPHIVIDRHGTTLTPIKKREIAIGTKVELEHTRSRAKARKIALEHLSGHPAYYSRLKRAGLANSRETKLDREISAAWHRLASGIQVPMLDIPKIFRDIKLELSAGVSLEAAVKAAIARYRVNNPHIVIDPSTNKIQSIRRGHPIKTFNSAHADAQMAARRLGRRQVVVAHPYVPKGFKKGVEVSPLFYHYGSVEVDSQGHVYGNPGDARVSWFDGKKWRFESFDTDQKAVNFYNQKKAQGVDVRLLPPVDSGPHAGWLKNPSKALAAARAELRQLGLTINTTPISRGYGKPEYRVNFIGGKEPTAYYTDDLEDAVGTGRDMAQRAGSRTNPTEAYSGQWFDAGKALWDDLDEREAQALAAMLRENDIESTISIDPSPKQFGAHRFSVYLISTPSDVYSKVAVQGVANRFAQALSEKRIMRLKDVPGMEYGSSVYTRRGRSYAPRKKKGILHRMIDKKNPLDLHELERLKKKADGVYRDALEALKDRSRARWQSFEALYDRLSGIHEAMSEIVLTDRQQAGLSPEPKTPATAALLYVVRLVNDLYAKAGYAGIWQSALDNPRARKNPIIQTVMLAGMNPPRKNCCNNPRSCSHNPRELYEIRLTSAPMIYTPGILRWAMNGYRSPSDREAMIRVFVQGYKLPRTVAIGLLSGKIPHKVVGEDVVFTSSWSSKGAIKPNPLTLRETARLAKSAGFWSGMALQARPSDGPMYRGYAAGRAEGIAEAITKYGPKRGHRVADRIRTRSSRALVKGSADIVAEREQRRKLGYVSNPATQVNIPWKEGQKIPIDKARAWVNSMGDPELVRQFEEAYKLQCTANRKPAHVVWQTIAIGSPRRIDAVTAMVQYGDSPETMYKPPQGSKKGPHMYRHEWGDGNKGGKKSVPLLAAPGGKAVVMPLGKGQTVGDWMRG